MKIVKIEDPNEKSRICEKVLRALPKWFGIESALLSYIQDVQPMETWAVVADEAIGFLSLNKHNPTSAEIHVMGLLPEYHGRKLGNDLILAAERSLISQGFQFLTVKTLGESRPDESYDRTRRFYLRSGFAPLEEFKKLWGDSNPCLMMVKSLDGKRSSPKTQGQTSISRPSSHFDQDLRDVPDDPRKWAEFIDDLKARLKRETDPEVRLPLHEQIGMAARTLMRLDEAESHLMKAVTYSYEAPSHHRLIQNLIRLAHVYQWKKDFEKSQLLFDQVKSLIHLKTTSEVLVAAYHQHLGKLFFDQGFYGRALVEFSTAISIRQRTGAPQDQLESSRSSYEEAKKRWGHKVSFEVVVRMALPADAEGIHLAHMSSIREICSRDHTAEEIKGWGHRPFRPDQRVNAIQNDFVLVVESQGFIEGYGHLRTFEKDGIRQAHLLGLYLTSKLVGKSFGRLILEIMMEQITVEKVRKVTLESSLTAQNFYRKFGFVESGPQVWTEIGGSRVRSLPMKMELP